MIYGRLQSKANFSKIALTVFITFNLLSQSELTYNISHLKRNFHKELPFLLST